MVLSRSVTGHHAFCPPEYCGILLPSPLKIAAVFCIVNLIPEMATTKCSSWCDRQWRTPFFQAPSTPYYRNICLTHVNRSNCQFWKCHITSQIVGKEETRLYWTSLPFYVHFRIFVLVVVRTMIILLGYGAPCCIVQPINQILDLAAHNTATQWTRPNT